MDFNKDLLIALEGQSVSSSIVPIMLQHRKLDLFRWALDHGSISVYEGIVDDILAANAIDFIKVLHAFTGNNPIYANVASKANEKNLTHILRWSRSATPWCMCVDECTCPPDNVKSKNTTSHRSISAHGKIKEMSEFLQKTIVDLQLELDGLCTFIDEHKHETET